ncbi:MAG TPA: hypothetical protein G4O01_02590 [Dehalococcoidia bacterium]|jgi:hypothetical protein|nr:hypothetical protein [Dehalococcoidia bacterium]
MTKKSRRAKLSPARRKKLREHLPATPTSPPVVPQAASPTARQISSPATRATSAPSRYPYVTAELKRIAILAGIMLVALIILALVLA